MGQHITLSQMIAASRDCGWTRQLHRILSERLTDADIIVLNQWLKVAEDERLIREHKVERRHKFGKY